MLMLFHLPFQVYASDITEMITADMAKLKSFLFLNVKLEPTSQEKRH